MIRARIPDRDISLFMCQFYFGGGVLEYVYAGRDGRDHSIAIWGGGI
jgi:hypothetical protein